MTSVYACILAGGQSRRFNEKAKGLQQLNQQPLLSLIIKRLSGQADQIAINSHHSEYQHFASTLNTEIDIISDLTPAFSGPLAGLYACMRHMCDTSRHELLLLSACDTPFLPLDLCARLRSQLPENGASCIRYQEQLQPTFSLWHRSLLPEIEKAVTQDKLGGLKPLLLSLGERAATVDYPEHASELDDPFFNINTEADLIHAHELNQHEQ